MSRLTFFLVFMLSLNLLAADGAGAGAPQKAKRKATRTTSKHAAAATPPAATADDVRQLRDALEAQQQHVQQLEQQLQQVQSQLQRAESAATDSQSKVVAIQTSTSKQQEETTKLQQDMGDFKHSMTAYATSTQEGQKRKGKAAMASGASAELVDRLLEIHDLEGLHEAGVEAEQIEGELQFDLLLPDKYMRTETSSIGGGMAEITRVSGINGEQAFRDAHSSGGGGGVSLRARKFRMAKRRPNANGRNGRDPHHSGCHRPETWSIRLPEGYGTSDVPENFGGIVFFPCLPGQGRKTAGAGSGRGAGGPHPLRNPNHSAPDGMPEVRIAPCRGLRAPGRGYAGRGHRNLCIFPQSCR